MTKEIVDKICSGTPLDIRDMTPEQKKVVYALFEQYGIPKSTSYHRLFEIGFRTWEIVGVSHIREEFLLTSECCVYDNGTPEDGSRGYGYVLSLSPDYDDTQFYPMICDLKIGVKLCEYMAERGMASQMTVRTRFKANDWKEWELKGIKNILKELPDDFF